ncbi:sigma-70 family RNA polymerase sigma factor [Solirubrobacter ginsenosidimutans]|uniref:Sigma-70 family RNA polymerase sigma factor n=1 Tax=Solirubrobacter ginsenosidimutans TaxID=490573 RepID=A0A9X3S3P0_9ACTN|nr:sigma-70 family RNA polymerase sigma factor [Solirubrobacter ginsenosidimutans]MDA0163652.1 sigma-70 family RNA polymerase sigma factor [Solirubrobacter ginsenosidimutans]
MYERHRPALRRQAARILYASGHETDDVLQDVFLRVHTALRAGVVPLEPRAWLLRLVHNACVDELRRGRTRPVGDVELDGVPALSAQLPDELARRAEARALLGDIHRLPDRQRSVLVMSAIDGLSHEEVAGRLQTTVETTRSLLARARENLRRTAAARETACTSVCSALDEAASAGVRASEIARRHLWSCSDCRAYQRDLRTTPSRLRRLAGWSPWGVVAQLLGGGGLAGVQKVAVGACCALVVGGGAVAVPELAVHERRVPQLASVDPEIVVQAARPTSHKREPAPKTAAADAPHFVVAAASTPTATARTKVKHARPAKRPIAHSAIFTLSETRRLRYAMRAFDRSNPTPAETQRMQALLAKFRKQPKGSSQRALALSKLTIAAYHIPNPTSPPRKGIVRPAPTATPVPTAAPTPAPTATPVPTATATPEPPAPTPTPSAAPVETPTASPTATDTPTATPAG